MTADDFRRLALELPGASEMSHMGHPDFRLGGKIFATLGYPDASWGMVKLTPEQQAAWIAPGLGERLARSRYSAEAPPSLAAGPREDRPRSR